jgi:predicted CXXCH cytochrome family protein
VALRLLKVFVCLVFVACSPKPERTAVPAVPAAAVYPGRQTCAGCHAEEDRLWQGSHHDLAMQEATERTVLASFDGRRLVHSGETLIPLRQGERFVMRVQDPQGSRDLPVRHVFGIEPLQQYLVELPGGRLQALSWAWDSRPAEQGGQRWFHLYPDEQVPPGDPLHWAGPNQRWNSMCAECHSTGLDRGYQAAEDRYETTWTEIDVSCEACHGPGSRHVSWARGGEKAAGEGPGLSVRLKDAGRGTWIVDPGTGNGRRLAPRVETAEIDTCGRCHSRRSPIHEPVEPGRPLLDSHLPALLDEGLYHADGQIDAEVYEYGSFLQSRMHRQGVTCSDCHEPHSLSLRAAGNALCGGCHSAARFDTPSHHRHPAGARGSACVDCHMPETTYMGVDGRRDHSLRVPRPDLSVKIGTPNACNNCHGDRSARWAARAVARWFGEGRSKQPHYGEAIHAGRAGVPGAEAALAALAEDRGQPAIARATAVSLLRRYAGPVSLPVLERSLADAEPLVRLAAVAAVESADPAELPRLLSPRLRDPVRAVRLEAARVLASGPVSNPVLEAALAEYRQAQEINADRPESRLNLGWLRAREGDPEGAAAHFAAALGLDPTFIPAYVNLADLYRLRGRDVEGERLLRRAASLAPGDARVRYALGLLLVRAGRLPEAVGELAQAVQLEPREPRYAYAYRLAVESSSSERRP